MLRCQLLIPHGRHPWVACREVTAICSSFLSASNQGGGRQSPAPADAQLVGPRLAAAAHRRPLPQRARRVCAHRAELGQLAGHEHDARATRPQDTAKVKVHAAWLCLLGMSPTTMERVRVRSALHARRGVVAWWNTNCSGRGAPGMSATSTTSAFAQSFE